MGTTLLQAQRQGAAFFIAQQCYEWYAALPLRTLSSKINCAQTCRHHPPPQHYCSGAFASHADARNTSFLPMPPNSQKGGQPRDAGRPSNMRGQKENNILGILWNVLLLYREVVHAKSIRKNRLPFTPAPGDPVAGHPTPPSPARQRSCLSDLAPPASGARSPPQRAAGAAYSCP